MKVWKKNLVAAAILVTVCAGIYVNWLYTEDKTAANLEELNVEGQFFVRYQAIALNTLNTSLLKKDLPELYKSYMKVVNSTRFTITPA